MNLRKIRKAPLIDIAFGTLASLEALTEYVGHNLSGNPELLQMARGSAIAAMGYFSKGVISYLPVGFNRDEQIGKDPIVNGLGIGSNIGAGLINEAIKNSGVQSKSLAANAFTAQCLLNTGINAAELRYKKD